MTPNVESACSLSDRAGESDQAGVSKVVAEDVECLDPKLYQCVGTQTDQRVFSLPTGRRYAGRTNSKHRVQDCRTFPRVQAEGQGVDSNPTGRPRQQFLR